MTPALLPRLPPSTVIPALGFALALVGLSGACGQAPTPTPTRASSPAEAAAGLRDLIDREWEERLKENPLLATSVGRHEYDHLLPTVTPSNQRRRAAATRRYLERSKDFEAVALSEQDRVSLLLFQRQLEERLEDFRFRAYEIPILVDDGFHIALARLPRQMPFDTEEHYRRYLRRLGAVPRYFDQQTDNLRAGLARGMTLSQVVLQGYEVTIATHVVEEPEASLFFEPFRNLPASWPESLRVELVQKGRAAVGRSVVPAYARLLAFMEEEYIPGARTTLGASELPDGERYYAQRIRHFTTLDLSAEEIHSLGLQEVERITGQMHEILEQVGWQRDLRSFLDHLRTDPRFYATSERQLLERASYLAKAMDGKLPQFFGRLPRKPYGVAPVPAHLAPKYTAGRYVRSPPGSTEPGWYWVNTYALDQRPLYALPALTLHEGVPGHHLQISLAQELEDLPAFRRYDYISAFGEGWGLYSEYLGVEAGIYETPYDHFGRLTYEMWRACRLVVDTGLHAQGWSREQALEYLASRTALSLQEVRTETDRYIAWPGQALAYKMGEIRIRELRARAESELGPSFDLRAFHDALLAHGSVTLPVLEEIVEDYIDRRRPSGAGAS